MKRSLILLLVFSLLLPCIGVTAEESVLVDISLYQPAAASSIYDDDHPAELANDGINDNETYTWWMSKADDQSAWWQVDLGFGYKLSSVSLEAKKGSSEQERKNICIYASNDADFTEKTELCSIGEEGYQDSFTFENSKKEHFRFVRIAKTDTSPLSIGDVHIYAKQGEILQGAEAKSLAGQIPAVDEEGRYIVCADVIGTPYEKYVQLLSSLNIMRGYPDGDFLPYESITRAEFSSVIAKFFKNTISPSERTFIDVLPEHWAFTAVETVASAGIINGVEVGIFMPDSEITSPQVIKMIVSLLGYGDMAEARGGYPYGYQEMAQELGLYKNYSPKNDGSISRGEIAILVYNSLTCDVMKVTSFGGYKESNAYKGETALTEFLNLEKESGIVTAVKGTSLSDFNKKTNDGYIEIGGEEYYTEIPNPEAYLGYLVDYYYEKDESDSPQIKAIVISSKNHVITVPSKELIGFKDDELIYGIEDEEKADVSDDVYVIYNGVARRVYTDADLLPTSGEVTLISNDGDYVYDVYIVSAISDYVVNWVNLTKKTVYSKDGKGSICLDPELVNVTVTHKATKEPIQLELISEWNILSVKESVNESGQKALEVVVSDEFIRGTLEGKGKDYAIISGRKIEVAPDFDFESLEIGAKGYFYIDAVDKLAGFNGEVTPGESYGFLRTAKYDTEGVADELLFRIFTKEGKFQTFTAAEKFILNGDDKTDKTEVVQQLKNTGINDTEAQVVFYTVNAKGMITQMQTTAGELSLDYSPADGIGTPPRNTSGYYLNAAEVFDALFTYNEKTLIVKLPASGVLTSEKDYKLLTSSDISKTEYYNSLKVYDVDENNIAKMILFTSGGGQNAENSHNLFLVDSLTLGLSDEGEVLYNVTGIYNGDIRSYYISEDVMVNESDFERGSVLTLAFTGELINDYKVKLYKQAKPEDASDLSVSVLDGECQDAVSESGIMGKCFLGYGTVTAKKDGIITVDFGGKTENTGADYDHLLVRTSSLGRIYCYDSYAKEVYVASEKEILDAQTVGEESASKVLITADSGNMRQLIIFN